MTALNQKGTLNQGIEYAGAVHRDFELRPLRLGDGSEAEMESQGKGGVYRMAAELARQIVSLGEIPPATITTKFLLDNLLDDDLRDFIEAQVELQKKIRILPTISAAADS